MDESAPIFSIRAVNAIKNVARYAGWDELTITGNESYYIEKLKDEFHAGNLKFRSSGRLFYKGYQIVNCGKQTTAEIRTLIMETSMDNLIRTAALTYLVRYPEHVYLVIEIGRHTGKEFKTSIKIDEITAQEFIKIGLEVVVEK